MKSLGCYKNKGAEFSDNCDSLTFIPNNTSSEEVFSGNYVCEEQCSSTTFDFALRCIESKYVFRYPAQKSGSEFSIKLLKFHL